jgi:hypothetical protein
MEGPLSFGRLGGHSQPSAGASGLPEVKSGGMAVLGVTSGVPGQPLSSQDKAPLCHQRPTPQLCTLLKEDG